MKNEYPNPMVTYDALDGAFEYFNKTLFHGELRRCLITVQCRRTACGFFSAARFQSHDKTDIADEIGLDPRYWGPPRTDTENLATLVHEMVHLWQHHHGRPSSGDYHNHQFSRKMFEVGLVTSNTGERGGKPTGTGMSHYIAAGGPFESACSNLLNSGFIIPYVEIISEAETAGRELMRRRSRIASKTTYVCPNCSDAEEQPEPRRRRPHIRVWGKPELHIICGQRGARFEPEATDKGGPEWAETAARFERLA